MGVKTVYAIGWISAAVFILIGSWEIYKVYAGWCCVNHQGVDYGDAFMWIIVGVVSLFLAWVIVMSLMDWYEREVIKCSSTDVPKDVPKKRKRK